MTLETGPLAAYQARLAARELNPDPEQARAIHVLQALHDTLEGYDPDAKRRFGLRKWLGLKQDIVPPRGVYLYGGVGRGKSMMMDLFYDTAPVLKKRRVHFHAFMLELHAFLHQKRSAGKGGEAVDNALDEFSRRIADESPLLCFDEFHVTDVADAMILGRLFTALFLENVVIVATSNWAPDDLYKDGLQRDRFLPFIALLKERLAIVKLGEGQDFRLARLRGMPVYYWPLDTETDTRMAFAFHDLTSHHKLEAVTLDVQGRAFVVPKAADRIAWFEFDDLCGDARGAADYLAVANAFSVVFLSHIPTLKAEDRNEAKRLMLLVDALYEHKVKLVISADGPPEALYPAGAHAFEFERTVSRLMEMQSALYLSATESGRSGP